MDKIRIGISAEVFEYIVDKAIEYKLGARGLRSIVETIMMDMMFELPSKKVKSFEVTLITPKNRWIKQISHGCKMLSINIVKGERKKNAILLKNITRNIRVI